MLAGRPPICGHTTIDTLRRLLIDEPAELRTLNRSVPADLDALVTRWLCKPVQDRYPTAAELAADLRRFLDGRPTVARPLTLRQRVGRWLHRNPALTSVVALATIAVALTVGWYRASQMLGDMNRQYSVITSGAAQLSQELQSKDEELKEQKREGALIRYTVDIAAADKAMTEGDVMQALAALERQVPPPDSPLEDDLRGLEWRYLHALATQAPLEIAYLGSEIYQI